MRHMITTGLLVGFVFALAACKQPAQTPAQAPPATTAPDAQTGTVERSVPQEQTGTVERSAPQEQTGTVERSAPVEQ